jgi:hypothetical protein
MERGEFWPIAPRRRGARHGEVAVFLSLALIVPLGLAGSVCTAEMEKSRLDFGTRAHFRGQPDRKARHGGSTCNTVISINTVPKVQITRIADKSQRTLPFLATLARQSAYP